MNFLKRPALVACVILPVLPSQASLGALRAAPAGAPSVLATIEVSSAGARLGKRLAAGGDINGDRYRDVLVTANGSSNGDGTRTEYAHIFLGSAQGLSSTPAWTLTVLSASETYDLSVAGVGDVNGDGYDDLLVGHPSHTNAGGGTTAGKIMLFLGSSTLPATTPDFEVESSTKGNLLGYTVSGAGDVNGDGYADFAAGSPFAESTSGESNEGRVTLWYGGPAGVSSDPPWNAESNFKGAQLGCALASAGDVNGDAFDDLLATACFFDGPETDEGQVRLYLGSSSGLSLTPDWTAEGDAAGIIAGSVLSGAGDLNGDGFDDILVGIPLSDEQATDSGLVRVYLGSAGGPAAAAAWTFSQPQQQGLFAEALFGPGDLTGDGNDDALMSTGYYDAGSLKDSGLAVLVPGTVSAPPTEPVWRLEGDKASGNFGRTIIYAGDVTGDGCGELVIGAPGYSSPESAEGRLYVYTVDANDRDGDAFCAGSTEYADCNDDLASAFPGAVEVPGNGIDESCDGSELCFVDADHDGFADPSAAPVTSTELSCSAPGLLPSSDGPQDCDDTRADVSPASPEVCDTVDNDCDARIDEDVTTHYLLDQDADGYGSSVGGVDDCSLPTGYVEDPLDPGQYDCDDAQSNIHPGADELPDDGIEQNCDGAELCYSDADDDGYRPDTTSTLSSEDMDCLDSGEAQGADPAGDCDDTNAAFNPGVLEVCDAKDNDCNLVIDNGAAVDCATGDFDEDGYTEQSGDCQDQQSELFPGAEEVCDQRDNNCDAAIDEGDVCATPTPEDDAGGCGCTSVPTTSPSPVALLSLLFLLQGLTRARSRR